MIRVPPSLHEAMAEMHFARDPRTQVTLPDEGIQTLSTIMGSARRVLNESTARRGPPRRASRVGGRDLAAEPQ